MAHYEYTYLGKALLGRDRFDGLRENYEYIRRTVGGPVCAVVKADAYGHGDNVIARVLQEAGAAGFAVSSLGEGRHLRRGGITTPILILATQTPPMRLCWLPTT